MKTEADLIQALRAEFGPAFVDLRQSLPQHPSRTFSRMSPFACHYLTIHHTTGPESLTWQGIAEFHVNTRGWAGIGYHFGIRAGQVAYLGSVFTMRAHVANRNHEALGLAFMGEYHLAPPAPANLQAARRLITVLDRWLEGQPRTLNGHKDMQAGTSCPGAALARVIATLRPTAPPPPQPIPAPSPPPAPPITRAEMAEEATRGRWFAEEAVRQFEAGDYGDAREKLLQAIPSLYRVERYLGGSDD